MTKCHFCGKSAPQGQYIVIVERLEACNACLKSWKEDPDIIYEHLARMCKGLGRINV